MKIVNTNEDAYGALEDARSSEYSLTRGQVSADVIGKVPVPRYMAKEVSFSGDEMSDISNDLKLVKVPKLLISFQEYNMTSKGYDFFRVEGQDNVEAVVQGLHDGGYNDLVAKTKSFDGIKPMSESFVTIYARKTQK
ncbi:MAG: hypothetical protein ABIH82_02205 [Candidatus Woesearchaeota archaeon]